MADEDGNRYRMFETLRESAAEKLAATDDAETARTRHRDCFVAFAEEADRNLRGPGQGQWLQRLDDEHDNLRVAHERCLSHDGIVLEEVGVRQFIGMTLYGMAGVAAACGSPLLASRLWGAAERLREDLLTPHEPRFHAYLEEQVAAARAASGDPAAFDRAQQAGRTLALDETIALARAATNAETQQRGATKSNQPKGHSMDTKSELRSASRIQGQMLRLGEHHAVAIYLRDGVT